VCVPIHVHQVLERLLAHFGPQHWWPGETPFEVCVGAVLTQNAAWTNVEKAIANLKRARSLTPQAILRLSDRRLAALIRPSGYFNVKARRLKAFVQYFQERHGASIRQMKRNPLTPLRAELLTVHGIGKETADSILLYALDKPIFVVDAYTRRIFGRHGWIRGDEEYDEIREMVEKGCQVKSTEFRCQEFNELHAQLVAVGKAFCHKGKPFCCKCPLQKMLAKKNVDQNRNSAKKCVALF
jgi:endonuclease-3 related protein